MQLRHFLISTDGKAFVHGPLSSRVALAEMTLYAMKLFMQGETRPKLTVESLGADWFREKQKDQVAQVKAMFELPLYYRQSTTGPDIPPPTEKEKQYRELRDSMNISTARDEEAPVGRGRAF